MLTVFLRAHSWRHCCWRSSQGLFIHHETISPLTIWLSRISWKQRLTLESTCSTQPRNMVGASQKLRCRSNSISYQFPITYHHRGRVIRELNLRREDLVITTKIYWGPRRGHINGGLSRKQSVMICHLELGLLTVSQYRWRIEREFGALGLGLCGCRLCSSPWLYWYCLVLPD